MGFFSNVLGATVKVALTPISVVKDAVNVASGDEEADNTKRLLASAGDDVKEAIDDLVDGEVL